MKYIYTSTSHISNVVFVSVVIVVLYVLEISNYKNTNSKTEWR